MDDPVDLVCGADYRGVEPAATAGAACVVLEDGSRLVFVTLEAIVEAVVRGEVVRDALHLCLHARCEAFVFGVDGVVVKDLRAGLRQTGVLDDALEEELLVEEVFEPAGTDRLCQIGDSHVCCQVREAGAVSASVLVGDKSSTGLRHLDVLEACKAVGRPRLICVHNSAHRIRSVNRCRGSAVLVPFVRVDHKVRRRVQARLSGKGVVHSAVVDHGLKRHTRGDDRCAAQRCEGYRQHHGFVCVVPGWGGGVLERSWNSTLGDDMRKCS